MERESMISSILRAFFRSIFVLLGLFVGFIVISIIFPLISGSGQPTPKTTLEILPDLQWRRETASSFAPVILQINIHGVIGDLTSKFHQVTSDQIRDILVDSRTKPLQNDRVKGILLHFNTPGGTVTDSDSIYRMLKKYKELFKVPIFSYVDGLCASGGMYIASASDRIFCSDNGIVGSIGVRSGPFFNVYDTITRWGIQAKTLTEGLEKDAMNPVRPWKPDEDANLKQLLADFYQQFVDLVTAARPRINKTKLINEYGAKLFTGIYAQEIGYVDVANSNYETALLALMQEAKIDPSQPYQVVELQPRRNAFAELIEGNSLLSNKREHHIQIGPETLNCREPCAYLYLPNG